MFRYGTLVTGRKANNHYFITKPGVKVRVTSKAAEDQNFEPGEGPKINVEVVAGAPGYEGRVFEVFAERFRRLNGHGN